MLGMGLNCIKRNITKFRILRLMIYFLLNQNYRKRQNKGSQGINIPFFLPSFLFLFSCLLSKLFSSLLDVSTLVLAQHCALGQSIKMYGTINLLHSFLQWINFIQYLPIFFFLKIGLKSFPKFFWIL